MDKNIEGINESECTKAGILMEHYQKNSISKIYDEKKDFIVIGLTGQKGSGCSTVAKILSGTYRELYLEVLSAPNGATEYDCLRDERIINTFSLQNWEPFDVISVRDVIIAFLMRDCSDDLFGKLFKQKNLQEIESFLSIFKDGFEERRAKTEKLMEVKKGKYTNDIYIYLKEHLNKFSQMVDSAVNDECTQYVQTRMCDLNKKLFDFWYSNSARSKAIESKDDVGYVDCHIYVKFILPAFADAVKQLFEDYTIRFQKYGNQIRMFGKIVSFCTDNIDQLSAATSNAYEPDMQKGGNDPRFADYLYAIPRLINSFIKALRHPADPQNAISVRVVIDSIKNLYESKYLRARYTAFYLISVTRNDDIRKAGLQARSRPINEERITLIDKNERPSVTKKEFSDYYEAAMKHIKKPSGDPNNRNDDWEKPCEIRAFFDSIKEIRKLYDTSTQPYDESCVCSDCAKCKRSNESISANESKVGRTLAYNKRLDFEKDLPSNIAIPFCRETIDDPIRALALVNNLYHFLLQDVESCIQDSDIFIANNETDVGKRGLKNAVLRYVSLILHPGLVTPTPIERCMQIAYTAKLNSGCISRQVGAVVTDKEYQILSLGWNDVPCGETSCNRRSIIDLCRYIDPWAFSDYEKGKGEFRKRYLNTYDFTDSQKVKETFRGVPASFCFKDAYCEITATKNQVHTRAMHGEEKALLTCNQELVKGGYLFTTSSPCEMCAKNAKEHRIKTIYYIEPYPGISQSHICNSGDSGNRAKFELFQGAIGRAYTQLYTPIMPLKDELELRGIEEFRKKTNESAE